MSPRKGEAAVLGGADSERSEHSHGLSTAGLTSQAHPGMWHSWLCTGPGCWRGQDMSGQAMTICQTSPSPVSMYSCISTFLPLYVDIFLCLCLPSLPSDITAVCALFPNRNDVILIIPCQTEKIFFFLFSLFFMLPFMPSFINPLLLFPVSPNLSTLLL